MKDTASKPATSQICKPLMPSLKNSNLDKVGFRDLKGFFLILFDDNQKSGFVP